MVADNLAEKDLAEKDLVEKDKKINILLEDLSSLESYISDVSIFSPLPLCFISLKGVILESNPAFETISKFSFDEIVGKPIGELFGKEEIKRLTEDTLKQGFVEGREMKFFPKGKTEIVTQVFTRAKKEEKGEIVGYFLALFDLTKIKKTERKLEEARATLEVRVKARTKALEELAQSLEERVKERTKGLVESREALINMLEDVDKERSRAEEEKNKTLAVITNFADGLLVFNEERKLSLINPQAEVFFGLKSQDITGRQILELNIFPSLEPIVRLVGGEIKGVFRKEVQVRENLVLEVSTIPILRDKEELGTLIISHDITREKTIERMKTEFVSLAAHQLRTPLSAIKWTLRMLLDGDLGEINEEQRDFMEKTYRSNERMIDLINDLLDVTRIEEGRYLHKPILTDLESIIQFVVNSYKEEIERKKLKLEFKKLEKKIPVMLDVEKIRLAIQNLLDNAVRYTPPGGEVTIYLKRGKKGIEFSVTDTGVGIPKDQQERVFTKFFRGANVMRMETEGSGLGLFITKNIIEAHGGKIWFESQKGKGTTFYFTIPIRKRSST